MPDAIVLVGLSASGKSTVGRMVAGALGRPFIDLDGRISHQTGSSPARIIERTARPGSGRSRPPRSVARSTVAGAVIATGGGAVIDPLNRWALWEAGTSVWLDAPDERLADRLRRSSERRPMVAR